MAEDCWIVGLHKKTPIHKSCAVQKSSDSNSFTVEDCTEIWDILGCSPTHEVSAEASDWNHFHNKTTKEILDLQGGTGILGRGISQPIQ